MNLALSIVALVFLLLGVYFFAAWNEARRVVTKLQEQCELGYQRNIDLRENHAMLAMGNVREKILKRGLQQLSDAEIGAATLILEVTYGEENN